MTASARGKKRTCQGCDESFYDLNKDPAMCPLCQHKHPQDAFSTVGKAPEPVVEKQAKPKNTDDVDVDENPDDDEDVLANEDDDDMDDNNADIIPKPTGATDDEA